MAEVRRVREFAPCAPWPELPAPAGLSCTHFGLADHGSRLIWAEGDPAGRLAVVLDNPGAREDRAGNPFVCGTRQTLRAALVAAGLDADAVYVTYLLKCRPRKAYDRATARANARPILAAQLDRLGPLVVVACGDAVSQTLFGLPIGEARSGERSWRNWPCVITYHPLAARRRPPLYPRLVEDFTRAACLLVGM